MEQTKQMSVEDILTQFQRWWTGSQRVTGEPALDPGEALLAIEALITERERLARIDSLMSLDEWLCFSSDMDLRLKKNKDLRNRIWEQIAELQHPTKEEDD